MEQEVMLLSALGIAREFAVTKNQISVAFDGNFLQGHRRHGLGHSFHDMAICTSDAFEGAFSSENQCVIEATTGLDDCAATTATAEDRHTILPAKFFIYL